jgi:hypothetical protein
MAADDGGGRPRPKTMVRLDVYNAYARLGVSPLMPTEEIKEVINRKRKDVMRRRRTRGEQQFGEEEAEMTRLQAIEDEIGTPKARARYDWLNPQNALLTVQPGPADLGLDPKHRLGLATAWLVEELGRERALPSPESLALWAPRGLDPELVAFLAAFTAGPGRESASTGSDGPAPPDLADLDRDRLGLAPATRNGPTAAGRSSDVEASPAPAPGGSEDG